MSIANWLASNFGPVREVSAEVLREIEALKREGHKARTLTGNIREEARRNGGDNGAT